MSTIIVRSLYQYPVKSCAGVSLKYMEFDALGPVGDRRFMVVKTSGQFISQRTHAKMALIKVQFSPVDKQLALHCPGQLKLHLTPELDGLHQRVKVWSDDVDALDMGDEAAQALSECLGESVRLVYFAQNSRRLVDPNYAKADEQVAFADGFPILICNRASLEQIYPEENSQEFMLRFRPNIVIEGAEAFAEDAWRKIKIGEQVMDLPKPCSRCVMPAINPDNAQRELRVIRKLAKQRMRDDGQSYFGINAIALNGAAIHLGQKVEVLE